MTCERTNRKIAIVGGGPGGYVAAIRASQLGASVTLIEKDSVGGTCLNRGCIPTKVLLKTARLLDDIKNSDIFGVRVKNAELNWEGLTKRKDEVIDHFVAGVTSLLKGNNVEVLHGKARMRSSRALEIFLPDGAIRILETDSIILALGSLPTVPPIPGLDLSGILTSNEALSLDRPPRSMMVIGGGVIGVELASAFASFGADVTIVEVAEEILPRYDADLVTLLRATLKRKGIKIETSSRVLKVDPHDDIYRVALESGEGAGKKVVDVEKVLVCVGRRPNTKDLNLDNLSVKTDRGRIVVDEKMSTSLDGVYAIGDCASQFMLAHVASTEGEVAAENAMGRDAKMSYAVIPSGVYTEPEMAIVGISEKEAVEKGLNAKVGRFSLSSNSRAVIQGQPQGMVKIVADGSTGEIWGAQMFAPDATDLVMEIALAMRSEATLDEVIATIHAHPTVSESIREASLDVFQRAIHALPLQV
ncbi:dihydrolipoyl dehydrogenase [Synergistales bacterium]|nr:dihydrolipoyl dehydrogenase [Synergistales bacterium]